MSEYIEVEQYDWDKLTPNSVEHKRQYSSYIPRPLKTKAKPVNRLRRPRTYIAIQHQSEPDKIDVITL